MQYPQLPPIDKSQIINYQVAMLDKDIPQVKPNLPLSQKYSQWQLNSKILQLMGRTKHKLRWIGNNNNSHLYVYAYVLLIATNNTPENFVEFKNVTYALARMYLDLPQQKILVQFLYLIKYTRDRHSFLNKYKQIQDVLVKLLKSLQDQAKKTIIQGSQLSSHSNARMSPSNGDCSGSISSPQKPIEHAFSRLNMHFPFIRTLASNDFSCSLQLFQKELVHIVVQKQCYFVVELQEEPADPSIYFTLGGAQLSKKEKVGPMARQSHIQISAFDYEIMQTMLQDSKKQVKQVEQSHVVQVVRGSQIGKKHKTEQNQQKPILNRFNTSNFTKPKPKPPTESIIHKGESKMSKFSNDRTLIQQLLNSVTIEQNKNLKKIQASQFVQKLQNEQQNQPLSVQAQNIRFIKEELNKLRQKLENKLKMMDEKVQQSQSMELQSSKQHSQPPKKLSPPSKIDTPLKIHTLNVGNFPKFPRKKSHQIEIQNIFNYPSKQSFNSLKKLRKQSYQSMQSVIKPVSPFPNPKNSALIRKMSDQFKTGIYLPSPQLNQQQCSIVFDQTNRKQRQNTHQDTYLITQKNNIKTSPNLKTQDTLETQEISTSQAKKSTSQEDLLSDALQLYTI